jgi:3-hydroxymyristoyl/3-hydroxydecanoyl-(acyl carrier protein) dehydratase
MSSLNHLIKEHLYHCAPNLLLEQVHHLNDDSIQTSFSLTKNHPLIQGHFPGLPILPGTQMLEMLIQSACLYMSHIHYPHHRRDNLSVGVFRKCEQVTFKNFARPDQIITCKIIQSERVDNLHQFKGVVSKENGDTLIKAHFSLVTIAEDILRG